MTIVLLVEDEPFNQLVIDDLFEFDEIPAELVKVGSGEDALDRIDELHPALILMDIGLPGISGLDVTRVLKEKPDTREIPVWALTAHAMTQDKKRALDAGCDQYVTKQISRSDFKLMLLTFLDNLQTEEVTT